jgi:AraC family transcriptional regulator
MASSINSGEGFMENDYILRINQALDYIYQNLDQNLTVEDIADHCRFSKYYFNRLFKSIVNESIYSFIKRIRLENAALKLRSTRRAITEIALEAGYSPSNFASAFKEYFGVSASEFRTRARESYDVPLKDTYRTIIEHIQTMKKQDDFFEKLDAKISIRRVEAMILEYRRFIGNYFCGLPSAWQDFCREMEQKYVFDGHTQFIGISYDDPLITDENRCIYDMCIKVEKANSVNILKIEGGSYACYEFYDRQENLNNAYHEFSALWLPFCKYDLTNQPCLEIYHSGMDDEGKIHLDICFPVKESA